MCVRVWECGPSIHEHPAQKPAAASNSKVADVASNEVRTSSNIAEPAAKLKKTPFCLLVLAFREAYLFNLTTRHRQLLVNGPQARLLVFFSTHYSHELLQVSKYPPLDQQYVHLSLHEANSWNDHKVF
jgi:hypothetical protein